MWYRTVSFFFIIEIRVHYCEWTIAVMRSVSRRKSVVFRQNEIHRSVRRFASTFFCTALSSLYTFVFVVAARQRAAWKELVSRRRGNSGLDGG